MSKELKVVCNKEDANKLLDIIKEAISSGKEIKMSMTIDSAIGDASVVMKDDEQVPDGLEDPQTREIIITQCLKTLGFRANLLGFNFIRTALIYLFTDYSVFEIGITKELYQRLAKEFNTTPQRVERAIRHSIEACWEYGNLEAMDEIFGYSIKADKGKPTNSEFIAMVYDYIRLNY